MNTTSVKTLIGISAASHDPSRDFAPDTSYVVGVLSNSGTGAFEAGFVKNLTSELHSPMARAWASVGP